MNNDKTYAGEVFKGDKAPDYYVLLIGTNDLLSDGNNANLHTRIADVAAKLKGDLDSIVAAMQKSNPKAKIYVMTVPCWTRHGNGNSNETHGAVEEWNKTLLSWAKSKKGVRTVQINRGMQDVATDKVFYGLESMFNRPGQDGLHPNAQGDLLMAGHLAQAMGIGGRTAGQRRKSAEKLAIRAENPPASYTYAWQGAVPAKGFTCDVLLSLGDGKTGGWNTTDNLTITAGDGVLTVNEAYLKWGDTVLYSTDMSANTANLRVAYVPGNSSEGLKGGYYVWLGDMLIGEALSANGVENKGVSLKKNGNIPVKIKGVAVDAERAYAPAAKGGNKGGFISKGGTGGVKAVAPVGMMKWREGGNSYTGGATAHVYGNSGDKQGDVWMSVNNTAPITAWTGAHGNGGSLNGNAFLRFSGNAVGGGSVFGAVNADRLNGMAYVELSAPKAQFKSFTAKNPAAVVGAFKADVAKNVLIVVNEGSISGGIMGGIHTGNNTIGSHVEVYLNGGEIKGNVMAGGATGTIGGNTSVTVNGAAVRLEGNINAGGTGGKILGKSMVCLQHMAEGAGGFDAYAGKISGGNNVAKNRTLELNNVKLPELTAAFSDFANVWVRGGTYTKISSLGGAKYVSIDEACGVEVSAPSAATEINFRNNSALVVKALTAPKVVVNINGADKFNFTLTKIPADVKNIVFKKGGKEYPARMTTDTQADTAQITPDM